MQTVASNNQPSNAIGLQALNDQHKPELMEFFAARPLQTFIQTSWINDNGVSSAHNRGTFYGYRNAQKQLEGVALIGHITLVEAQSDNALRAFAHVTQKCAAAHTVLGDAEQMGRFQNYYQQGGIAPRLICRELLFEKRAKENVVTVPSLRRATLEELELIVPVHAQSAFEESGVNPLDVDPRGFRQRCARRINLGRTWVAVEDDDLKFKADVISDTPEIVYLEGIYVSPEHRGNGFGARCMTQLTNLLLERTNAVCLLVNETNTSAQNCYRKAGYQFRDYYETLFLNHHTN